MRRGLLQLCRVSTRSASAMRSRPRPAVRLRASPCAEPGGQWGYGIETSRGKDTPSGHWEIAGTPVDLDWGYFPETIPAFPESLTGRADRRRRADRHPRQSSRLGHGDHRGLRQEHLRTGKPICYTSADSVPADRRARGGLRARAALRSLPHRTPPLRSAQHRARHRAPLRRLGAPKDFVRTPHRKDFAVPPPDGNLLQRAAQAGRAIVSIGKIGDIFAHRDTGLEKKGKSNDGNVDLLLDAVGDDPGRRARLRQSGRFRHRIRASPRRARLRRLPRGVRPAPKRDRGRDAGRRLLPDHRRSRQRSDLQGLRPHPRARADRRLRRRRAGRADRRAVDRSPTSPRPSPPSSACRRGDTGGPGRRERHCRKGRNNPSRRRSRAWSVG